METKQERDNAARSRDEIYALIARVQVGSKRAGGLRAMRRSCDEAHGIALRLARSMGDYAADKDRFFQLYYGPMNIIELWQKTDDYRSEAPVVRGSEIEALMVQIGGVLSDAEGGLSPEQRAHVSELARQLKSACDQDLSVRESRI